MLPQWKKCLSHQNPLTYLFRAVLACKRCLICADFSPDSDQTTFSLEVALLWIMDSYFGQKSHFEVKNVLMMDLFLTNMQLDRSGVDYCDVFISCLDSHSDGTHSLQRIHCWANDATFLQIWWRNKLIYILDGLRVSTFLASFQRKEIMSIGINFRETGALTALWQALFFLQ